MNSKDKGNTCEAVILAALVRAGRHVLCPFGDNLRYDLAIDDAGKLVRVQCKTGRQIDGTIKFNTCSSQAHRGRSSQDYRQQADYFGVYVPSTCDCYLVPVEVCGQRLCTLRISEPKNGQKKFIRYASAYKIGSFEG